MDWLYNRIILYNKNNSPIGFIYIYRCGLWSFNIIYFRLALKALDVGRFRGEWTQKMKYQLKFYHWRAEALVILSSGEILQKVNLVKLELSKEIFLKPEYPNFGSRF